MDNITNNHLLIVGGIMAIIAEVVMGAATGFDLLLTGVIFIMAGGIGLYLNSFPYALGAVAILSFIYIFIGRRFIKNKLAISSIPMGIDNLLDKKAKVTKAISRDKPGQVKVEGETWRAESDTNIAVGDEVEIKSISGVTLKVK